MIRFLMFFPITIGLIPALLSGAAELHALEPRYENDNLRPEEVLVIANEASDDSMDLARYHINKRKIPKKNLFTIHFPKLKHHRPISHQDFQEKIVLPLQRFLEKNKLKETILVLVTVYDVPY